ncbi:putative nucleotidyltransferase with HDIG domain [Desulfosoma caldarium]|uniref:Putative nucleotidyltransferase with HDIG domain n=2 Tax=Desulfosoma caldarium TaxID=610254 RepID=A0A3N1UQX7_9BACT|nr:putative nucleotidyltransferase with HDIG domain [Desulfosoma caldarium]
MIECLEILQRVNLPAHIVAHSLQVARCAVTLARHLNGNSHRLHLDLVCAGGLLHDIAKDISLKTGENHAHLGASMLEEMGLSLVAPIVRDHIFLDESMLKAPFSESIVVNYADKRVKHEAIVLLDERFEDLLARYGTTPEKLAHLKRRWQLYKTLERTLFAHTSLKPEQLAQEAAHLSVESNLDL